MKTIGFAILIAVITLNSAKAETEGAQKTPVLQITGYLTEGRAFPEPLHVYSGEGQLNYDFFVLYSDGTSRQVHGATYDDISENGRPVVFQAGDSESGVIRLCYTNFRSCQGSGKCQPIDGKKIKALPPICFLSVH